MKPCKQRMMAGLATRRFGRQGTYCGAWARSRWRPCRAWPMRGGVRCIMHGGYGISGPKTPEGKARISTAVAASWARWREERSLPADWRYSDSRGKGGRISAPRWLAEHGPHKGGGD